MYVDTAADAAFTLWLATRDNRKVEAERNVRLTRPEKRMLSYAKQQVPKVKQKPGPKPKLPAAPKRQQQFTRTQIEIALRAMTNQEERSA